MSAPSRSLDSIESTDENEEEDLKEATEKEDSEQCKLAGPQPSEILTLVALRLFVDLKTNFKEVGTNLALMWIRRRLKNPSFHSAMTP